MNGVDINNTRSITRDGETDVRSDMSWLRWKNMKQLRVLELFVIGWVSVRRKKRRNYSKPSETNLFAAKRFDLNRHHIVATAGCGRQFD